MSERRPLATPEEVSAHLQVAEKTLAQWRYLGKGPRFSKIGRHVRYRWNDVEMWLEEQTTASHAP
jgi:hypothetical protein